MKYSLNQRERGVFEIGKLFRVSRGRRLIEENRKRGKVPYYSASSSNNGLTDIISNPLFIKKKSIIVTTFCDAYFVNGEFTASDEITILENDSVNKYIGRFIAKQIAMNKKKFAFGYKAFTDRLKRQKILLPITATGEPDYNYMEQYIYDQEQDLTLRYNNYIKQRAKLLLVLGEEISLLKDKQWREFDLANIFNEIERGKRLKKGDHQKGKIPYISSTSLNNGVDGFIGNKERVRIFGNCLTIANSGSVGATFYQPFSFIASDHVTKLQNIEFSKYIYLFLSSRVRKLGEKYSFNREINDLRIRREKILLPINSAGEPDYEFMEKYMRQLELQKLRNFMSIKQL